MLTKGGVNDIECQPRWLQRSKVIVRTALRVDRHDAHTRPPGCGGGCQRLLSGPASVSKFWKLTAFCALLAGSHTGAAELVHGEPACISSSQTVCAVRAAWALLISFLCLMHLL